MFWRETGAEISARPRYLSNGGAQERYGVVHFHGHSHGRHMSLTAEQERRCQGELGLAGQWGGQELLSTLVHGGHVLTGMNRK